MRRERLLICSAPAGTYEMASVSLSGNIAYSTHATSVPTDYNVLRQALQVDVVFRQGLLTTEEKSRLGAYWSA